MENSLKCKLGAFFLDFIMPFGEGYFTTLNKICKLLESLKLLRKLHEKFMIPTFTLTFIVASSTPISLTVEQHKIHESFLRAFIL